VITPGARQTATFALSGYSFSDPTHVRDEAVLLQTNYPISTFLSVQSNDELGRIAISQVGRNNGILIDDTQDGREMLANNQYNLQLTYSLGIALQATLGYTYIDAQGCNSKIAAKGAQPCYPYRSPTAVSNLAWTPFPKYKPLSSTFIQGSIQGTSTSPFKTSTDDVLQTRVADYYDTTASQVSRSATLGSVFINSATSCATFLLTTANRGGDVNNFARGAPIPGFTDTASLEFVPGQGGPSFVAAYSRIHNDAPTPPSSNQFLFRVQFGLPYSTFGASPHGSCAKSS